MIQGGWKRRRGLQTCSLPSGCSAHATFKLVTRVVVGVLVAIAVVLKWRGSALSVRASSLSRARVVHVLGNRCIQGRVPRDEEVSGDSIIYVQLKRAHTKCIQHRDGTAVTIDNNQITCGQRETEFCASKIVKYLKLNYDVDLKTSVLVCVDCSGSLKLFLSQRFETSISVPARDYSQATWLHSLGLNVLKNWPKVKFEINVITTCRETLYPLLEELRETFFIGDQVNLEIAAESTATEDCLDYIDDYDWPYGFKRVRHRLVSSGGPQIAIPEAVRPLPVENSYSVLLEDDVMISRQFYSWLKFVGLQLADIQNTRKHRYFSISLYTPRVLETGHARREKIDYEQHGVKRGGIFGFEIPCSWGAAFNGVYWKEALLYFQKRHDEEQKSRRIIIPRSRVTGWKGSWKKWLIELGYTQHWTTIYPIFPNETSFSTNKLMVGEHIGHVTEEMRRNYTVPLFTSSVWFEQLRRTNLFVEKITVFDAFFTPVVEWRSSSD